MSTEQMNETTKVTELQMTVKGVFEDPVEFDSFQEDNCFALLLICADIIENDIRKENLKISKYNLQRYLRDHEVGDAACEDLKKSGIDPYQYAWNILKKNLDVNKNEMQYPIIFSFDKTIYIISNAGIDRNYTDFKCDSIKLHFADDPNKTLTIKEPLSTKEEKMKGGK